MSDYITIPLSKQGKNKGKYEALISVEDAVLASYRWSSRTKGKYAHRMEIVDGNRQFISLHREVVERVLERKLLPSETIDHINRNGLDNRRENLRLATHAENHANRVKQSNNTSGFKGVTWSKRRGKWQAQITLNQKNYFLGYYTALEDAYKAYCDAVDKYHQQYGNYGDRE